MGEATLDQYAHMQELRQWLLKAGMQEGKGLFRVLDLLDREEIADVKLLRTCWPELRPMLRKGPAARLGAALGFAAPPSGQLETEPQADGYVDL